jgi:hypothetical protein
MNYLTKEKFCAITYLKEVRTMDRKELLLRLFKEFHDVVDYLYGDGLYAHLGERLMWFGSMLSKVGWILVWGEKQDREKMFKVIEDTLQRKHKLKCSWEEWLCFKLRDVVEKIDRRAYSEEREEQNPELPQTQKETDELPF